MKKFTALHLSDLHLFKAADHDQKVVLNALFEDIKSLLKEGYKIDAVFFTGDLIVKGKYEPDTPEYIKQEFILPLLNAAQISSDRLFITPGNHDMEMSKSDSLLENVYASFKRHTDVNALIDTIENRTDYWAHLSSFNQALTQYGLATPVLDNTLFRSYLFNTDTLKIGVGCINSAWRSSGKPNDYDYGHLLVGERQVEKINLSLEDVDLKIALIHHPLDWLTTYEKPYVQRAIYRNFDALLHGHNHIADAISLATSTNSAFISNAGCLYQNREYFNGYSLIQVEIEPSKNVWTVSVREYYENRQKFDVSTRFASDGKMTYVVGRNSIPTNFLPSSTYIEIVNERLNSKLLSYAASDIAPKTLHGIFVDPPLSHLSEKQFDSDKGNEQDSRYLNLHELALNENAIFFMGTRESGKTTLLNFLCSKANDPIYLKNATHSIYIDLSVLRLPTRASILDSAVSFCGSEYNKSEIIRLLNDGRVIVCFDNLPLNNSEVLNVIAEFIKEFKKCKFCFAAEESIEQILQEKFIPIIGVESEVVYIHSFNRKQTRELVNKWFPEAPTLVQEKVDAILDSIKKLGVPQTPFLISILLWIKEKNINFTPINHSAIIDTFIDGLLEKLTESKDRSNTDSTIKRHYLMELAYAIHQSKKNRWTQNELEKFTVDYFAQKALNSSTQPFLDELFKKGILINLGEEVCFKFDCFRSFFLAHKIGDSSELKEYALSLDGFLKLSTEIDFYTGLHRDKIEFLHKGIEIIDSLRDDLKIKLDLQMFDRIIVEQSMLSPEVTTSLKESLFSKKPSVQEQEEIYDDIERRSTHVATAPRRRSSDSPKLNFEDDSNKGSFFQYYDALRLASIILRNSELVNDAALKHKIYNKLLVMWSEVLLSILLTVEKLDDIKEQEFAQLFPGTDRMSAKYIAKLLLPNVIFTSLKETIGTGKLQVVISDHIDRQTLKVEKLLSTFLYVDLALPSYLDKLDNLIKECSKNRYVLELIFFKLLSLFLFKNISDAENRRVEELVGNVFVSLNDRGSKVINDGVKTQFLASLQNRRLTDQSRKRPKGKKKKR